MKWDETLPAQEMQCLRLELLAEEYMIFVQDEILPRYVFSYEIPLYDIIHLLESLGHIITEVLIREERYEYIEPELLIGSSAENATLGHWAHERRVIRIIRLYFFLERRKHMNEMYGILLIGFSVFIAITEGYHGSTRERRISNPLIRSSSSRVGAGILDFHSWRMLTHIVVFIYLWILTDFWFALAIDGMSFFVFERFYTFVRDAAWFTPKTYKIAGLTFRRKLWQDWTIFICSIILYILAR